MRSAYLLICCFIIVCFFSCSFVCADSNNSVCFFYEEINTEINTEMNTEMNNEMNKESRIFDLASLIDLYNPSDDFISMASDEQIAKLMMDYPLLWLFTTYDENIMDEVFFEFLKNECSVFEELLKRENAIKCLLDLYSDSGFDIELINRNPYIVWENNQKIDSEIFCCHFIKLFYENFNVELKEQCDFVKSRKQELYSQILGDIPNSYFSFGNNLFDSDFRNIGLLDDENLNRYSNGYYGSGTYIQKSIEGDSFVFEAGSFHKYDVRTSCSKWYSGAYSIAKKQALDASLGSLWTLVASASPNYNCHSYAWLIQNTNNDFWLDTPYAYTLSQSVSMVGDNVTNPSTGDIVVLYSGNSANFQSTIRHSAIVKPNPSGTNGIYTVSKIGGRGVYEVMLDNLLLYYQCNNYRVFRITGN